MESQLAISMSVNEVLSGFFEVLSGINEGIISLERRCWKNKQYSQWGCIEIVGIPSSTNDTKVCELTETATGISLTPASLEASHCLPADQNDKLIIKFSRRKDVEMVLSKEKKILRTSILEVLVMKVVKSLSMKVFVATIISYGINAKLYGQRNGLKLSGLAVDKSKSELNLKVQLLELLISQICRNYFQAMIFSLNKFTITSRHWYRSFCVYILRIYAKMGLRTLPLLGWTLLWH